jgi:hypothetical protein
MRRVDPDALLPRSRPAVAVAPFVHATLTVPVPSSAVEAFATTGSYEPKFRGLVLTVQLTETVTDTVNVAVAVAARTPCEMDAHAATTATTAVTPASRDANRRRIALLVHGNRRRGSDTLSGKIPIEIPSPHPPLPTHADCWQIPVVDQAIDGFGVYSQVAKHICDG